MMRSYAIVLIFPRRGGLLIWRFPRSRAMGWTQLCWSINMGVLGGVTLVVDGCLLRWREVLDSPQPNKALHMSVAGAVTSGHG